MDPLETGADGRCDRAAARSECDGRLVILDVSAGLLIGLATGLILAGVAAGSLSVVVSGLPEAVSVALVVTQTTPSALPTRGLPLRLLRLSSNT
jgi:hypothetical protein